MPYNHSSCTEEPDYSDTLDPDHDWVHTVYGYTEELLSADAPEPRREALRESVPRLLAVRFLLHLCSGFYCLVETLETPYGSLIEAL